MPSSAEEVAKLLSGTDPFVLAGMIDLERKLGGNNHYIPGYVNGAVIVYHTNLLLLAIFAFWAILRLPLILARLRTPSEWLSGNFLYHTIPRRPHVVVRRSTTLKKKGKASSRSLSPLGSVSMKDIASDDSHTLVSHGTLAASNMKRVNEKGAPVQVRYPHHVAECPRRLRRWLKFLWWRVDQGVSVAQMIVMLLYFCILVYPSFYKSSPFTDPERTGWVALSQMPIIFAFAAKNGIPGTIWGYGYEKLNWLHRYLGILVVIATNVHALGYVYRWTLEGIFVRMLKRSITTWGMIGLVALDMIYFFSTPWWRRRAYNVFFATHVIGYVLVLPAVYLHMQTTLPYIIACAALLAFDVLLRLLKTRFPIAIIRPLPELGITRVEVPSLNAGWRAGQHVRIRILSTYMGIWGWTEMHPFTIASVSKSQEGLVLLCKKTGKWTTQLYEMSQPSAGTGEVGRQVRIMIEGPYGGPGHTVFASYSAAVFVVGGSGITFALSAAQDLVEKDRAGRSRVKIIEIVWTIPDPAALIPLLPILTTMIEQSVFSPLRISVYYTRAPIGKFPFTSDFHHPGLTLAPGRPKFERIFETVINRAVSLGSGRKDNEPITGVLVGVCGPLELADEVVASVGRVDPTRRDQVGGIEVHEEIFGW
ncbi:hypothetical protein AX16_000803 [Volvariella volvacea WC 439]|nr:hypothetical protein AX16_000803 [Volvariella volvacea WC 439]